MMQDDFAFEEAVIAGDLIFIKKIIKNKPEYLTFDNYKGLYLAAKNDHFQLVKFFTSFDNVDVSCSSNVALFHAIRNNNTEMIYLLLKNKRMNASINNNKAIIYYFDYYSNNIDWSIVKLLWETDVKTTLKKDDLSLYNLIKIKFTQINF
jgi:hypothetical protein